MNALKTTLRKKTIAVIAADNKQADLIKWSYEHREVLSGHHLVAGGKAGYLVEGILNGSVCRLGGDALDVARQISHMLRRNEVDVLVFFADLQEDREFLRELCLKALASGVLVAGERDAADLVVQALRVEETPEQLAEVELFVENRPYLETRVA